MSILSVNTIKSLNTNGPVFQNSSGVEKGTLCKAWVNFNAQSSGTDKTIRASFNVDSVTDIATGRFAINFTSGALADANYTFSGNVANNNGTMVTHTGVQGDGDYSTSILDIRVITSGNNEVDRFITCIQVHGN
tara:strand:- start:482 stop:883 length:402 start_codon:yes stop_codon:yes gene_type:complete